jgi:hypothetical protein
VKREILIGVALVVMGASLYVLKPLPEYREVNSKVTVQPLELHKIEEIEIKVKYKNKTLEISPYSDEGKKLLFYSQQILSNLEILEFPKTFKEDAEITGIKETSSYVEIVMRESQVITFGQIVIPAEKLVLILEGRHAGLVASQPRIKAPWRVGKIPQDFPSFLRLVELVSNLHLLQGFYAKQVQNVSKGYLRSQDEVEPEVALL